MAHERGMRMILDTSGAALHQALDAGIFLVKPNISELAELVGDEWIEDEEHLRDAASNLVSEHNCEAVVVSLGAAGAMVATRDTTLRIPAPPVYPESKVGAGDSMVAGITWGMTRGWSIVESASLGVAAGSAAVMTPGSDLCRREDTERLYAQVAGKFDAIAVLN
ncbi:MAG: PfkB family carbohydrate kinase [Thermomicrobiales bacterium]